MPNFRIIFDNAADRAALVASSTAGAMAVNSLVSNTKADVWRSIGTSATITATWPSVEVVGGVVLPFCNLTEAATIRVRGYANAADSAPLFDTGAVEACPAPPLELWGWGVERLGSNAFAYGGGTYGRVWIPTPGAVTKLVVDLVDPGNPAGYLELSRLVCGDYWEPAENPDYGVPITPVDTSKHVRTESGDLVTDTGTRSRKHSLNLSAMSPADRSVLWGIVQRNGMRAPLLFSLYPNHPNPDLEQTHQIWCKFSNLGPFSTPHFQRYATTLDLEEV